MLESQLKMNSLANEKELSNTKNRILVYETEMGNLRRKIEQLGDIIEEESMLAKRGRNTIRIGTKRLCDQVVQQSQQEFTKILKSKEQEATIRQSMQEEADAKIRELEHKLMLQEKELRLKEMELLNAKMRQERRPNTTLLNHQHVSGSSALSAESTSLSLKNLLRELLCFADVWEDIGIMLGIDDKELNHIKANYFNNNRACLREMLRIRLKRVSPPSSWLVIAKAIEELGK